MTPLALALGAGLLLSLVNPGLFAWVAVGLLLPFTPDIARGAKRAAQAVGHARARHPAVVPVAVLAVVLAIVVTSAFLLATTGLDREGPSLTVVVETDYLGEAGLREDPGLLAVTDTLFIKGTTLEAAAKAAAKRPEFYRRRKPPSGRGLERAFEREIVKGMAAEGWTQPPPSTAGLTFTRERDLAVNLPMVKAQGTTAVEIPHPRVDVQLAYVIDLPAAQTSKLVVTAEKGAIGDTFPGSKKHPHQVNEDLETTVIPMPEASENWELSVRRDLFREDPFVRVADFTFGKVAIGLLVGLLALAGTVAKDEVKAFLKRLLDRILKRPKRELA